MKCSQTFFSLPATSWIRIQNTYFYPRLTSPNMCKVVYKLQLTPCAHDIIDSLFSSIELTWWHIPYSYAPGSWVENAGGMCLKDYSIPKITSLLLIGPKGSGKSSLINKISGVLEDGIFASERAQVSCMSTISFSLLCKVYPLNLRLFNINEQRFLAVVYFKQITLLGQTEPISSMNTSSREVLVRFACMTLVVCLMIHPKTQMCWRVG